MAGYYDKYNEYQAQGPVVLQRGVAYVLGYEEARQVLGDSKRFVKDLQRTVPAHQRHNTPSDDFDMYSLLYHNMLETDPPDHTRLRSLISKAFTSRHVQSLAPRIQEVSDKLIDQFQDASEIELIDAYAFPLPIVVICELLGVPIHDRDKFRAWSHGFLGIADSHGEYFQLMQDFLAYIGQMIAERRANPKDDLISRLVHAEESGDRLTEQEMYSMIALLIVAGHETTVNLISGAVANLLQNRSAKERLIRNPSEIERVIEELLRFEGPVEMATTRYAAEEVTLGNRLIKRGTQIVVILAAANRDPQTFEAPLIFDPTRDAHKHLGFGYGIHYCVGAPLARLEAKIAINNLFKRLPEIELAVPPHHLHYEGSVITGLTKLPLHIQGRG